MNRLSFAAAVITAACLTAAASAQSAAPPMRPFLDPLFSGGMVLQRGMSDPVWGWTTPGAEVTVQADGKTVHCMAGPNGEWQARLPELPTGGPYTLTASGPETVTIHNVLVGDVWVCSGQSNMQFGIGNGNNAKAEIAAANYPNIRLFFVPNRIAISPKKVIQGTWEVCTPENIQQDGDWNGFSAVAYYFGRDLYRKLHVPIGLIHSSVGGTPAESWTGEKSLRQNLPEFRPQLAELDQERALMLAGHPTNFQQMMAQWYRKNDPGSRRRDGNALGWAAPTLNDSSWKTMNLPGYFQDAGDPQLEHVNGIVWFRKTFDLPAAEVGHASTLHFFADDNDTAWVNGVPVGATEGYNTPRSYAIPPSLLKAQGNVIAVRVLDTGGMGGIWGVPSTLYLQVSGGAEISLVGPWRYKLGNVLTNLTPMPQAIENNTNFPTVLYNGMIHPLMPFGMKGVIWYQGENNSGRALQYKTLLPTMIDDWRSRWSEGNFPFLIVQLAAWQPGGTNWAQIQQVQWMTAHDVPNSGIATAVDIGNAQNIHPTDKQDVGKRLALVAEAKVYHQHVSYSGPVYKSMSVQGNAICIHFKHIDGGLVAKNGKPLTAFEITGIQRNWVPAAAKIVGKTVVVSSPLVPYPMAVRYAWSGFPLCSLYNKAGLPAFPFRTDSWRTYLNNQ